MLSDRWYADLPFRGRRTYVHSTSICNHLRARFGELQRLELVMRDWMTARVLFAPMEDVAGAKATLRLVTGSEVEHQLALTDDPAHAVTAREPFDEDAIVAAAPLSDRTLTVPIHDGATVFDRLVSGNKALITRALAPDVRLIAAKIALDRIPDDGDSFQLRLDAHVGTRIYRSAVLTAGDKIGEIVFYGQ